MAVTTYKINPIIIKWMIEKLQFENISSSVFEILNSWLSGQKEPTFNQIEKMSKKTNIPFGYFFLQTPPMEECSIVEFRTIDSIYSENPSRNLIDIVDMMDDVKVWMREYLIGEGFGQLDYVGMIDKTQDNEIIKIANKIRDRFNIEYEWYLEVKTAAESFKMLRKTFEDNGIILMMNGVVGQNNHRPLSISEFRAFTLVDNYAPLIFINANDSYNGKVFSLLHEMVHVWMGVDSFYNDRYGDSIPQNNIEKICNAIAAEILVPKESFIDLWNKNDQIFTEKIEIFSKYFKCSVSVIARKALDLGYIKKDLYKEIIENAINHYEEFQNKKINGGGDYYRTLSSRLDHRFVKALEGSAKEGKTQYTEVYKLTNTNRTSFEKLLISFAGGSI